MATKIILKKSTTGGSVPLASDLDGAEIAINLVDRKIYTKDGSGTIQRLDGAYIDSVAPSNPTEGDIWYDTTNNLLKAHNGSSFVSAGYATISELDDVTLTSAADGELLRYDGSGWVNNTLAEADIQSASSLESDVESLFSVTDAGGDGSLTYEFGVFTYTGPSAAETRAHFTEGTGVTITAGSIAIGQAVATTDNVEFASVQAPSLKDDGGTITIDPTGNGDNTGSVIVAGNLTVNGTTTSVNSNEVNIGDSVILLNADETSTPSQDGGIEIERGTATNVSFVWDETNDYWTLNNEQLANVTIDGGSY